MISSVTEVQGRVRGLSSRRGFGVGTSRGLVAVEGRIAPWGPHVGTPQDQRIRSASEVSSQRFVRVVRQGAPAASTTGFLSPTPLSPYAPKALIPLTPHFSALEPTFIPEARLLEIEA